MTQITDILRDTRVVVGGTSVLSAALGAFGGYRFAQKRLRAHYEGIAEKEIEEAKRFYKALNKESDSGERLTPQQILEQRHGKSAADVVKLYQEGPASEADVVDSEESAAYLEQVEGRVVEQEHIDRKVVQEEDGTLRMSTLQQRNVFETSKDGVSEEGWDYETELARRSGDKPYVITHDEFYECELDYEQISLTYYEGDDVLVDDADSPIQDTNTTVGDDNLTRFGHGSKDDNVVYIRNDKRNVDFEVVRSTGKYAHEVLGFDAEDELRHSHKSGLRKFRGYDD